MHNLKTKINLQTTNVDNRGTPNLVSYEIPHSVIPILVLFKSDLYWNV